MQQNMKDKICSNCQSKIEFDDEIGKFVCGCGIEYDELMDEDEKETGADENEERNIQMVKSYGKAGNEFATNTLFIRSGKKTIIKTTYSKKTRIDKNNYRIQKLLQGKTSPQMIEKTKILYRKFSENKNMQGKNINNIIIGLFYYVCRIENVARTKKEISKDLNVPERLITKSFNRIKSDIVEPSDENYINKIEENFVNSFIGINEQTYDLRKLIYTIINNFNKGDILEGKTPETIVGLSILFSYKLLEKDFYNKEEMYKEFSTENTLKKAFEEIKDCLDLIIPKQYSEKIQDLKYNLFL